MPEPGFTAASFYRFLGEGKLMGSRCRACGALYVPCRPICPACHGAEMDWREMSGRGKLVAFTSIEVAPSILAAEGYGRDRPYLVGIVELEEGPRVSARILGLDAKSPEHVAVGKPLRLRPVGTTERGRPFLAFEP